MTNLDFFHNNFAVMNPDTAYEGDLGERFSAVVNQKTFIEVCSIAPNWKTPGEFHHVGLIRELSDNVYDLSEFEHKYQGDGLYFMLDTEADVQRFLGGVAALMVHERP